MAATFSTDIPICFGETDPAGVVYYPRYFHYYHRAFETFFGACHGVEGQGNYALQAPPLAGQDDWYLKRQLENFRKGIRGTHDQDNYGHQMVLMARSLQNEQSIDDMLAYLNSL